MKAKRATTRRPVSRVDAASEAAPLAGDVSEDGQPLAAPSQPAKAFVHVTLGGAKSRSHKKKAPAAATPAPDADADDDEPAPRKAKAKAKAPILPMSAFEAGSIRDKLIEALLALWPAIDTGLTKSAADHEDAIIWQTIDEKDTAFIADFLLKRAQQSAAVAQQVRAIKDQWDNYRLAAIIGPRALDTFQWYPEHGMDIPFLGLHTPTARERRARKGQPR